MNLRGTCLPQHIDNAVRGRAAHDGIIDHDDSFSGNRLLHRIQLDGNAALTAALGRLDKGSPYIAVFYKCHTIGNTALHGITHRCHISGLRNADHKVCIHRRILCQKTSRLDTGCIDTLSIDMAVRTGKINIFKNTSCMLFFRQAKCPVRGDPVLRGNGNDLSRLHIAHILCA